MADQQVFVLGSDGNLWLEEGSFGTVPLPDTSYPPGPRSRAQIDGSVGAYWALDPGNIFVLGQDANLWYEFSFGTTLPAVPPPRYQVDGNVQEFQVMGLQEVFVLGADGNLWHELGPFGYFPEAGGVYVIDGNLDLWQVGPPPVQIDGSVIDFQPLSPEQMLMRWADRSARPGRRVGLVRSGRLLERA